MQSESHALTPLVHLSSPSFRYGAAIDIPASPEQVWRVVADYGRDAEWREGVEMRAEPAGLARPGTRTFERLRLFGDAHRVTAQIREVEAGRWLRFVAEDGRVEGVRRVSANGAGARFEIEVAVELPPSMALLAPLMQAHFRRRVRRDLARLRGVVLDDCKWQALGLELPRHTVRVSTAVGPLAVTRVGTGERVIVLWHGLWVDSRSFWPILPALSGEDRTLLLVDGPGHGKSPGADAPYDLEDCADAVIAVLDHFGVQDADFVGHAWGGHVGVVLAARRSRRLRRLAVLSSPLQALAGRDRLKATLVTALVRTAGVSRTLRQTVADVLFRPATCASRPDLLAYLADAAATPHRAQLARAMRAGMLRRPSLVERLDRIEVPTLVLATDDDPLWPVELAAAQAAQLREGRFEVVPGSRHMPVLEAPERTAALLAEWLG